MSRDIKKCYVSDNGKTYCWDNRIRKWVQFTIEEVPIKSVPEDVLEKFCKDSYPAWEESLIERYCMN